jgi:3-oxoadipate enol-lactonase
MSTLSHDGVSLYYEQHGDAGDPLLCIMGLGAPLQFWQFQTPAFARTHRVCVFDNRGIGRSDKPKGPYTIRALAEDALAVMDACGFDRAHVLGLSMGGMIAQELALRHPDRLATLTLACTFAKPDDEARTAALNSPIAAAAGGGMAIEPVQLFKFMMGLVLTPEFMLREKDWLRSLRDETMGNLSLDGFFAQYAAVMGHDAAAELHTLALPTLVMTGTADLLVPPRCSDELARLIPDAKLLKFEGGSHGFNVEQADKFNRAVLDFLAQHPLSDARF